MNTGILKWNRVSPDSFDLRLQDTDLLDHDRLKTLYKTLLSAKFAEKRGAKDLGFPRYIRDDLRIWIDMPEEPFTSRVYVTLSNWFLSIGAFNNSERGIAAAHIWDFLFRCRPTDRLSAIGKRHEIIPERFDQWWARQQKLQGPTR
jgi:hypothetical protein